MSEHQRETAFLRQLILYDDTAERPKLEEIITQLQRNERCVRRAVSLMVLLAALAMAGLGYCAVFCADYPQNMSRFMTQFITKVFGALGMGSLICLLAFVGFGVGYRKELDQRREECRRLATKLLESCLGKPCTMPLPGQGRESQTPANRGQRLLTGKVQGRATSPVPYTRARHIGRRAPAATTNPCVNE